MEPANNTILISWAHIRQALLYIPAFHIALCFIFLAFYAYGFGRSIETFYSPSDVLHVSFKDIAGGYVSALIVMIIGYYVGTFIRGRHEKALSSGQTGLTFPISMTLFWLVILNINFFVILFSYAVLYYYISGKIAISIIVASIFAVIHFVFVWRQVRNFGSLKSILLILAAYPPFLVAFSGAQAGELDSIGSYQMAQSSGPVCGNYAIIRALGDRFLAVGKDNQVVIVNEDCERRFIFSPPVAAPSTIPKK